MNSTILQKIAEKQIEKDLLAEEVIENPELLPEIFGGLNAEKADIKFGCDKILRMISRTRPSLSKGSLRIPETPPGKRRRSSCRDMQTHSEKVTAVIVDDEELARQMIREYLGPFHCIEILAECASGKNAVKTINASRPDLLFLDIQMPGMTGFEVLTRLDWIPLVIFSTAYDRYALRAFEVNAIDYLLKPYDRGRFEQAVNRALDRLKHSDNSASDQLLALLNNLQQESKSPDRFWIREAGTLQPVRCEEIDWISAMDDYACFHVGKQTFLVSQTMQNLETILDDKRFMRIHRSSIVNLDRIKELRSMGDGSYEVILKDGTKLALSRGKARQLKGLIL